MIVQIGYGVGSKVRIRNVHGGYRLPDGLPEGVRVAVVAKAIGVRTVEWEGKWFEVSMACIDSGWLTVSSSKPSR